MNKRVHELVLPTSYEEIVAELENRTINEAMMDFFIPVTKAEESITELSTRIRNSGKLSFIVGRPGVGKSTFLQSLSWRKHILISSLEYFDADIYSGNEKLIKLIEFLNEKSKASRELKDKGPMCIVVNYLESLSDLDENVIKGFFRDLNGVLRKSPFMILWPLTEREDAAKMMSYSKAVSGTLFHKGLEELDFSGPKKEYFCDIATRTIETINGIDLSSFNLNTNDLESILVKFNQSPLIEQTIRKYLDMVKEFWEEKNNYFQEIRMRMPKPNEVWFVFSYKNAEDVVKQFSRQSEHSQNAWMAIHEKLFEYVRNNDQRKNTWSSKRLQLAVNGAIKTRIIFMSTNALIMAVNAYSEHELIKSSLEKFELNQNWGKKNKAQEAVSRTPMIRLLKDEDYPVGKKKGSRTQAALDDAEQPYKQLNRLVSTKQLSDNHINSAIAECIEDCTGLPTVSEKPHPFIKGVIPDVMVELDDKQICMEFHYTDKDTPGVIADYVLKKLHVYMNQIEGYSGQKVFEF